MFQSRGKRHTAIIEHDIIVKLNFTIVIDVLPSAPQDTL